MSGIFLIYQHGGDVNAADHTGQTALHWSAVRGAIQVAELLLREGARISTADMYGYQVRLSYLFVFGCRFCDLYVKIFSHISKIFMSQITIFVNLT